MKKIVTFILLMCMALTVAACTAPETTTSETTASETTVSETTAPETAAPETTAPEADAPEITMQEIFDANQPEALFKNHQSISICNKMGGELWRESYLTKEYFCDFFPGFDGTPDWAEFVTADAFHYYTDGDFLRYLSITPDGVGDFASYHADFYVGIILGEESLSDTIESVSQKDGRITVKSFWSQELLEALGVSSANFEYVLDANTYEAISITRTYTLDDGSVFNEVEEITYDAEASDLTKDFLAYATRTENLRNITVVSNPGTDQETSKTVQTPKGLVIGFRYDEEAAYEFKLYTDAACTEAYDPYVNTDADLTVYVTWSEATDSEAGVEGQE